MEKLRRANPILSNFGNRSFFAKALFPALLVNIQFSLRILRMGLGDLKIEVQAQTWARWQGEVPGLGV